MIASRAMWQLFIATLPTSWSQAEPSLRSMGDPDKRAHQEWIDRVVDGYGTVIVDRYDPAKQPAMKSNAQAWRRWNPDDEDVRWALEHYGQGVHRSDLWAISRDLEITERRRRAFVVTLLWGVGTTNRYYGRHSQALASAELNGMLDASVAAVRRNDLAGGWSAIYSLPGLGFRFFTKWLWVAGVGADLPAAPLVFDQRVIDGLAKTKWPTHPRQINNKQRWLNYCGDAAAAGKRLGVNGEWIEYWLFSGALGPEDRP
jgi:hypothetical protein